MPSDPQPPWLAGPLLIDGHVHLHACFDLGSFFGAAAANLDRAATRHTGGAGTGCLLFAEAAGAAAFEHLRDAAEQPLGDGWKASLTLDTEALLISAPGRRPLLVCAGRQVVTRERLEVLALMTRSQLIDGLPLAETLRRITACGALPVIPWGFGKWWFQRGRVVERVVSSATPRAFLGDNGGRPAWASEPRLFGVARSAGLPIIPGSDPLPFRSHQGRAGSCGFIARVDLPADRPASALREYLQGLPHQPPTFGHLAPFRRFIVDQVRMQLRPGRRAIIRH